MDYLIRRNNLAYVMAVKNFWNWKFPNARHDDPSVDV